MVTPDIETSTREERLEFIREEFKCLGNCPICGKCSFLRGREAEDLYADYIECKKQVFDQQFSEKLDSADFGKLVLHIVIDKAVMRQRAAASLLGA